MVYLDYSATTPVNRDVLDVFTNTCINYPGNCNSIHSLGVKSKMFEEESTSKIARLLGVKASEIIYTSGASEANNTAIKGVCLKYHNRGKHIITTKLEHSSVLETFDYLSKFGFDISFVDIREDGCIDIEHFKSLIRDDTILVSICAVSSELGIIQPIDEIGKILKNYPKCYFHVDCTQAIGKINIDFSNIDFASMSAHKFYGIVGIGILYKKENIVIEPLIHGGKSSTIYRSGTPSLGLIASTARALELVNNDIDIHYNYVVKLNKMIRDRLKKYDNVVVNSTDKSIPYIINFSILNIKPETFVHALESMDVYISTKSACSNNGDISKSVYALTKNKSLSYASLRISLSYMTTEEEVLEFLKAFDDCYYRLLLK